MKYLHQFYLNDSEKPIVQMFLQNAVRFQAGDTVHLARTTEPGLERSDFLELSGYYRVGSVVHQLNERLSQDFGHEVSIVIIVNLY